MSMLPSTRRSELIALLVCIVVCRSQTSRAEDDRPGPAIPRGTLLLMGGAERDDNHLLWSELVHLAGGKGARVAVFPTGGHDPERSGAAISDRLQKLGLDPFVVPAALLPDADHRRVVRDPRWVERVRQADAVFLGPGRQSRYRQVLIDDAGKNTPLLDAILHVHQRGGLVAGTSAGTAVMSRLMYVDADFVLPVLLNGVHKGKEVDDGFGLVRGDWFIDQHCLVRGRFARALVAMQSHEIPFGLGIDEDTAVVIEKGRTARVVGYRGAMVFDLSEATQNRTIGRFNLQNVRLSFLSHGDRIDLATREVTVAPEKAAHDKIDPQTPGFEPYYKQRLFFNDILGNTVLLDLMYKLVDSPHDEAVGLAFDGVAAKSGDTPGFEFRFYRGKGTVSWDSHQSHGDPHTVSNVYLDIRPITVHGPLYE
jgi:cyanophycinase